MLKRDIVNRVQILLDELTSPNDNIGGVDIVNTNPIGDMIESQLEESIDFTLRNSRHKDIPQKQADINTAKGGAVALPFDFLRVVSFKCSEWQKQVIEFSTDIDKSYNEYLSGGNVKPKIYLIDSNLERAIKYKGTLEYFNYVPLIEFDQSEDLALSDAIIEIIAWVCASKVLTIIGEDNSKAVEQITYLIQKQ